MADDSLRAVDVERTAVGRYVLRNARGGAISVGGADTDFTAVELLLGAIGACTAVDVDTVTSRRAEPNRITVRVSGDKIRDDTGSRMTNLNVVFTVNFPDGAGGDAARAMLPRVVQMSHDRLCTVTRTIEQGTPVSTIVA
jgi:uncharacterized OsmC-like protein